MHPSSIISLPTGTDHLPNCHSDRECLTVHVQEHELQDIPAKLIELYHRVGIDSISRDGPDMPYM